MSSIDEGYSYYTVSPPEPKEEFKLPEGFVEWDVDANAPMYTRDYFKLRDEQLREYNGRVYQAVERNEPIPSRGNIFDSTMDEIRKQHEKWCRSGPVHEVAELYGTSEEDIEAARRVCYPEDFGEPEINKVLWVDAITERIRTKKRGL